MKTKYTQIVKLKKRALDEIERELIDVRGRKREIERKIEDIDKKISNLEIPKSGKFAQVKLKNELFQNLMREKEALKEKLEIRLKQIEGLKELYKEANVEYEKILHLDKTEVEKELKKLRYNERKELDEIANILHNRENI
jgi:chromosome segregation ATPase